MKIVSLGEYIFYKAESINRLRNFGDFAHFNVFPSEDNIIKHAENAKILITWGALTPRILEKCKKLRKISLLSTGVDEVMENRDLVDLLKAKGIEVTYTPNYSTESVAEFTVASILGVTRHIFKALILCKSGDKATFTETQGRDLASLTVGVVGMGAIGTSVAGKLSALGCKIISNTLHPKTKSLGFSVEFVSLDQLLTSADVITIHTPLNASTNKLFNAERLGKCKRNVILINNSRSDICDINTLYSFLASNPDSTAFVDGINHNEVIAHKLLALDNFFSTPHIAFNSIQSLYRCTDIAVNNVVNSLTEGEVFKLDLTRG